jgi:hypothetical protein
VCYERLLSCYESYVTTESMFSVGKKELKIMILPMLWDIIVYLWTITLNAVTFIGLIVAVAVLASLAAIPPAIMLWAMAQVGMQ